MGYKGTRPIGKREEGMIGTILPSFRSSKDKIRLGFIEHINASLASIREAMLPSSEDVASSNHLEEVIPSEAPMEVGSSITIEEVITS